MLKELKEFAMRGNVIDMAVGIIIGVAFGTIVKSIVTDIIMPPIGLLLGNVDFTNFFTVLKEGTVPGPYFTLADAQKVSAVTVNYGVFVNTIVSFLDSYFRRVSPHPANQQTQKERGSFSGRTDDQGLPILLVKYSS